VSRFLLVMVACIPESRSSTRDAEAGDAGARDAVLGKDADRSDVAVEPDASEGDAGGADASNGDATTFPGALILGAPDRPAPMKIPSGYAGEPLPIVVLLHGYTVDAATQDTYFGLSARVDDRRYFLVLPDGTREASAAMNRFWNATDACCNFYGSAVDDVGYILALVEEARASVAIDRVYLVGHSNGGFMTYRIACDAADRIDAIASLAGATFFDEAQCGAARPISVLQIHGTQDGTILYGGVATGAMRYPGAEETVRRWATRAGCDLGMLEAGSAIDLDVGIAGDETEVETYRQACGSVEAEHWRIQGGGHIPALAPGFADLVLDWLFAH
jgi:polyhydroxybutyrate depolymerase